MPHISLAPDCDNIISGEELEVFMKRYSHPITQQYKQHGYELCGRRWIDYAMDSRLIYCLNNGLPLDMDVYDAAEWSCLVELTDISARNGGLPVEIPDFTRGRWNEEKGHTFHNI